MGWGDFGSNGSVHWRIHYHDNQDKPGSPPVVSGIDGNKKHRLSRLKPRIGEMTVKNRSHPDAFRVIARYESPDHAFKAVLAALIGLFEDQGKVKEIVKPLERLTKQQKNIALDVNVMPELRESAAAFQPPEVTVEW
jgi:hypothetical protein